MADIRHAIVIDAPPERIYPLIATPGGLAQWWATDVTTGDGHVDLGFFNRQTIYRLAIASNAAPAHIEWLCLSGNEWLGTRLIFDLKDGSGKTHLRFTHADWKSDSDYFVSCTTTWGELMFRLKAVAEGKKPGPLFLKSALAY